MRQNIKLRCSNPTAIKRVGLIKRENVIRENDFCLSFDAVQDGGLALLRARLGDAEAADVPVRAVVGVAVAALDGAVQARREPAQVDEGGGGGGGGSHQITKLTISKNTATLSIEQLGSGKCFAESCYFSILLAWAECQL